MTSTIRLTAAEAIVRFLTVQRTVIDGREEPLIPGVFAIFGHGNVTCLGPALHAARDELPTWRGQNEQGMALAATAYAKAMRRRQLMAVTTSIGPGALNLVTAAGVAMANRLPVLLLSGDTFQSRLPDPVLQQLEHFDDPSKCSSCWSTGCRQPALERVAGQQQHGETLAIATPAAVTRLSTRDRSTSSRPSAGAAAVALAYAVAASAIPCWFLATPRRQLVACGVQRHGPRQVTLPCPKWRTHQGSAAPRGRR